MLDNLGNSYYDSGTVNSYSERADPVACSIPFVNKYNCSLAMMSIFDLSRV